MSKEAILSKMKLAMLDLEDEKIFKLIQEGLDAGIPPIELITHGMNPALSEIGYGYEHNTRFMNDLVLAGEIMNDSMKILAPVIAKAATSKGGPQENMVIGTVEGDQHTIGKRIVAAMFTGQGYKVTDIGEDQPATAFVKAAKDLKATVVGASAILGPLKAYCKVISQAMIDAGIRDKVIFIIGGWGMTQAMSDLYWADCFGDNAVDAVAKVKAVKAGEIPRFKVKK